MATTAQSVGDGIPVPGIRPTPDAIDASVVLRSMRDAFCALDRDWRVVELNERLQEIWGLRREDVLGRSVREILPGLASDMEAALDAALTRHTGCRLTTVDPVRGIPVEL